MRVATALRELGHEFVAHDLSDEELDTIATATERLLATMRDRPRRHRTMEPDEVADYKRSVHYAALVEKNDLSAPTCKSCHGAHGATPPGVSSVSNVCGTCHATQREKFDLSPHKEAFAEVLDDFADRFDHLRAYTTTGVRPETDFFLWKITERYDDLGDLGAELNATPLAGWLQTPYSYLATTKASEYTKARKPRKVVPKGSPYLVVYPFVKLRSWYSLSQEDRQRAMDEHIRIGREEFPGIKNHTTYSFGIDDQEFMTAFECEEPADFMHLMLRLRDSEASRYTERDTPIFVGRYVPIREALAALDGASARVEA